MIFKVQITMPPATTIIYDRYLDILRLDARDISNFKIAELVTEAKKNGMNVINMVMSRHETCFNGECGMLRLKKSLIVLRKAITMLPTEDVTEDILSSVVMCLMNSCDDESDNIILEFLEWLWGKKDSLRVRNVFDKVSIPETCKSAKCTQFLLEAAGVKMDNFTRINFAVYGAVNLKTFKIICPPNTEFTEREKERLLKKVKCPKYFDYIAANFVSDVAQCADNLEGYLARGKLAEIETELCILKLRVDELIKESD